MARRSRFFKIDSASGSLVELCDAPAAPRNCATWPMQSYSAGVTPDQIPEALAADRRMGVAIDYDAKTGDAIFTSPAQRKRYCEAHGLFDRNGGYGDPQQNKNRFNPREGQYEY